MSTIKLIVSAVDFKLSGTLLLQTKTGSDIIFTGFSGFKRINQFICIMHLVISQKNISIF